MTMNDYVCQDPAHRTCGCARSRALQRPPHEPAMLYRLPDGSADTPDATGNHTATVNVLHSAANAERFPGCPRCASCTEYDAHLQHTSSRFRQSDWDPVREDFTCGTHVTVFTPGCAWCERTNPARRDRVEVTRYLPAGAIFDRAYADAVERMRELGRSAGAARAEYKRARDAWRAERDAHAQAKAQLRDFENTTRERLASLPKLAQ
jgi:hypothetical protein